MGRCAPAAARRVEKSGAGLFKTATDVALARSVEWNARVILAVPCCHHEVSSLLDGEALPAVQQHGIFRERLAEMLTDAMRAELLESCGYRTKIAEFIRLEHTPKNVLIRGVRETKAVAKPFSGSSSVEALRSQFRLPPCTLERRLQAAPD